MIALLGFSETASRDGQKKYVNSKLSLGPLRFEYDDYFCISRYLGVYNTHHFLQIRSGEPDHSTSSRLLELFPR